MTGEFEPDKFEDRYERRDRADPLQAGGPSGCKEKPSARPANVVNLMEALRRSVEGTGDKGKARKRRPRKPRPQPGKSAEPRASHHRTGGPRNRVAAFALLGS
jgi:non-homologous end joining protein Ku